MGDTVSIAFQSLSRGTFPSRSRGSEYELKKSEIVDDKIEADDLLSSESQQPGLPHLLYLTRPIGLLYHVRMRDSSGPGLSMVNREV